MQLVFITIIDAGSGLICNDFRNNLMEVYFSKPLNWRDYVMGKVMTLVTIGMALSAIPTLFMALLHVLFVPTLEEQFVGVVLQLRPTMFEIVEAAGFKVGEVVDEIPWLHDLLNSIPPILPQNREISQRA